VNETGKLWDWQDTLTDVGFEKFKPITNALLRQLGIKELTFT